MRSSSRRLKKANDLAHLLRQYRIQFGKTKTEIANKVRTTSPERIHHIEKGLVLPDSRLLKELIDIYKMNAAQILQIYEKERAIKWNFTTITANYFKSSTNEVKSSATTCKKS